MSEKTGFSYVVNASKINFSVASMCPMKRIRQDLLLPEIHLKNLRESVPLIHI